jgi:hypothetical protein
VSGGREVRDDRDEWELETLMVRSVSDHLSVGFTLELRDDPLLKPDEFKLVVKAAGRDVNLDGAR